MLTIADTFCLLPLYAGHLNEYHQELLDNVYTAKIEAICPVSEISFMFICASELTVVPPPPLPRI